MAQPTATGFDRFTPEHVADPYPLYDRVRERGPFLDRDLGMWIVAGYDDVRTVLSDHRRFSSDFDLRRPQQLSPEVAAVLDAGYPEVRLLVNQDPPDHTAVRALTAGAFNPRRVRELTPVVRRLTDDMIDRFDHEAGRADLVGELAWPLPLTVICALLGLPAGDGPRIRAWIDALVELTSHGTPPAAQLAAAHESVAFERYLADFIADRRARRGDDLTSELLASTQPALTDTQMVSMLINLVFAGHETTANLIGNTLLALLPGPVPPAPRPAADDPAADDTAADDTDADAIDPEDIDAAVEETLRRDPPVQGMFRRTRTDAELGGATIPAGAMVFAVIGAANRDPAVHPAPAAFLLRRTGPRHLAFGQGVHYCLGAQLAKLQATTVVATVLRRLPGIRLAPGAVPAYLPNLLNRGPRRLDVRWEPVRRGVRDDPRLPV